MADIRTSSLGGTPFGVTDNRPSSPSVGQTYFNGELGYLEIYTSAGWIPASGGNDFNLNLTGLNTKTTFSQSYASGSYSITSSSNDSSMDIYAYTSDGTIAGYTNTKALTTTERFNKIVVIGGTSGDVLGFSYKTTYATSTANNEVTAGPYITSLTPATLADVDDTTTITGGNFATDVQVVLIGSDNTERSPKALVRNSSTSLTLTRPDSLPTAYEPYSVKAVNPGITSPTGSNLHILSNAIDAGSAPVWTTSGALTSFKKGTSYTYNLSASDADAGITYAVASGALPGGLSLNTSTGVISGTPTANTGTPYSFVVAATDTGGNSTNSSSLTLSQVVPDAPTNVVATTTSTTEISVAFNAPSYTGTSSITGYTVTSSTGNITGTGSSSPIVLTGLTAGTSYTFTVKATNSSGDSNASSNSNSASLPITFNYVSNSVQTWTAPSGVTSATFKIWGAGGGNAANNSGGQGGYTTGTFTVTAGRNYNIYVGNTGIGRTGGWPGGGTASSGGTGAAAGGGGGYSAIQDSTNNVYLAIAGAGGGAISIAAGYNGGGTTGQSTNNLGYGVNTGGTQSAGGVAGVSIDGTSGNGSSLSGGNSSNPINGGHAPGGGGGSGYYGGAGGVSGGGAVTGGPGGSGYVNASYSSDGTTIQGYGTDSLRGSAGAGGNAGRVVIIV
jgi:hypothetical protein